MKKVVGVLILSVFLVAFGMNFVSASAPPVEFLNGFIEGAFDVIKPILLLITGDTSAGAEFFLAKIMFLIIVFSIIWKSLDKITFFAESSWVHILLTSAVSILSIRWFGDAEIVRAVLLPYSAIGIAISAGIPFVLFFMMTEFNNESNKVWRKISWVFFSLIFIALWITRYGESTVGGPVGSFSFIYLVTAMLGMIVYFTDSHIQKLRHKTKLEKTKTKLHEKLRRSLKREMNKLAHDYHEDIIDKNEYEREMKILETKLNSISA